MSVKYCLPVPVFYFWRKLTHPAARSLCDSWVSCIVGAGARRKLDGAEQWFWKTMQRNGRSRSGNRVGVTEIGWSAEQLFRRSRSANMLWVQRTCYSEHEGCIDTWLLNCFYIRNLPISAHNCSVRETSRKTPKFTAGAKNSPLREFVIFVPPCGRRRLWIIIINFSMLLSLTRLKMAGVDVDGFNSMSAIALTAVVGAVILLLVFLCNFVKKGFEKSKADSHGTPLTFTHGCRVRIMLRTSSNSHG